MNLSTLKLKPITEDEVVSIFLKGEIKSKRFSTNITKALRKLNSKNSIITNPNINNPQENNLRKNILEKTRGYISKKGLFEGFPTDIKWYRVVISKKFLLNKVMYIDYDYWVELSNGSRLPKDGVKKISSNEKVFDISYDGFIEASEKLKRGGMFEEIILVSDKEKYVVLEGHLRLTVFALNKNVIPKNISVIIGFSKRMNKWSNF